MKKMMVELFDLFHEAMIVVEPGGAIRKWSRGAESLYGYSAREAVGRLPRELLKTISPKPWSDIETKLREQKFWEGEFTHFSRDGREIVVSARLQLVPDSDGVEWLVETNRDVTGQKKAEGLLRLELIMAYLLASAATLEEALKIVLEVCLQAPWAGTGWAYLREPGTGSLSLVCKRGPKQEVAAVRSCKLHSQRSRTLKDGRPFYCEAENVDNTLRGEGILSLLALPVKAGPTAIGVLCIAFDSYASIPDDARLFYESIAYKTADVVARIRMRENQEAQKVLLEEANTALRVLLKQRDEDRAMLERILAENIHKIVMPCMEKLRKSRPTERQRLLLDILEAQLKEIVTPFSRKTMVASFLSPCELRVAEFIRHGRSTNEIARALGASKSAVLFHRKNIRHKLGLTGKKINLSSYLSNPEKW